MKLSPKQLRTFRRIRKKYNVSVSFILSNMANIRKLLWYGMCPRLIIKRMAVRRHPNQRIVLEHYRLRRALFDQSLLKIIKRRKRNVRQWSQSMVRYLRCTVGIKEYVEEHIVDIKSDSPPEDVSKKLKEQLELLKRGNRTVPLIDRSLKKDVDCIHDKTEHLVKFPESLKVTETTPEKQIITLDTFTNSADVLRALHQRRDSLSSAEKTENCDDEIGEHGESKHDGNFIDMLMRKVQKQKTGVNAKNRLPTYVNSVFSDVDYSISSNEDFAGFEECVTNKKKTYSLTLLPTPIVTSENKVFVSENLDRYLQANSLSSSNDVPELRVKMPTSIPKKKKTALTPALVTLDSVPPAMEKLLVPASLQRLRTVAERRQFMQRYARNHKFAIINNEAAIYRELHRKSRRRSNSMLSLQTSVNQVPFTRKGWVAASFLATEFNKYYYQMLPVDESNNVVRLTGSRGNNAEYSLPLYFSRWNELEREKCGSDCLDTIRYRQIKVRTTGKRVKLNKSPLSAALPACPLSRKPFQKPLDDDTAALLTSGGKMLVVRMPIVALEVFPELGKPLDELARRYLQQIMPHLDITREWAQFSVSTLQPPPLYSDDTQSFIFPIPYANDRNQILVRRVIDRSEKLDKSFEAVAQGLELPEIAFSDLSFRAKIDTHDNELVVCADILSDMINSVAISCSENSFVKDDPDANYTSEILSEQQKKSLKVENGVSTNKLNDHKSTTTATKKQNRLVNELRRLNATIIDAGSQSDNSEDSQYCNRDYCRLGCICGSLSEQYPLRQHCGKSRCIIECCCKTGPLGRIMRLETDGRFLTSEDAYHLRQKATASLARMEKEFSATIVLTEKETMLINESQYDKKRRCTKTPKRYEDYAETTDNDIFTDYGRLSTKKQPAAIITKQESTNKEVVYVEEEVLQQLRHCTVNLMRLDLRVEPWCLVHELYKCFCGGNAVDGKPIRLEKATESLLQQAQVEALNPPQLKKEKVYVPKIRYKFEKHLQTKLDFKNNVEPTEILLDEKTGNLHVNPETQDTKDETQTQPKVTTSKKQFSGPVVVKKVLRTLVKKPLKPQTFIVKIEEIEEIEETNVEPTRLETKSENMFYQEKLKYKKSQFDSCRRAVAIPAAIYQACNANNKKNVYEYICKTETEKSRLLLNEHTLRSVYFHKQEMELARKRDEDLIIKKNSMVKRLHERFTEQLKRKFVQEKDNPQVKLEKTDNVKEQMKKKRDVQEIQEKHVLQKAKKKVKLPRKVEEPVAKKSKVEIVELSDDEEELIDNKHVNNPKAVTPNNTIDILQTPTTSANTFVSALVPSSSKTMYCKLVPEYPNMGNKVKKEVYDEVMTHMNSLVGKKMHDIDFAMKRLSKIVPPPNNEVLSIMTWSIFLEAFKEVKVFIWQVKLRNSTFLAATLCNIMPVVVGAIGILNIVYVPPEQLPLMGRMLVGEVNNAGTSKLGVILQGRTRYWIIKGFLHADEKSACRNPTPESHPLLTKKTSLLFALLIKQHLKRMQRSQDNVEVVLQQQIPEKINILTLVNEDQEKQQDEGKEKQIQKQPEKLRKETIKQKPEQNCVTHAAQENIVDSSEIKEVEYVESQQKPSRSPLVNNKPEKELVQPKQPSETQVTEIRTMIVPPQPEQPSPQALLRAALMKPLQKPVGNRSLLKSRSFDMKTEDMRDNINNQNNMNSSNDKINGPYLLSSLKRTLIQSMGKCTELPSLSPPPKTPAILNERITKNMLNSTRKALLSMPNRFENMYKQWNLPYMQSNLELRHVRSEDINEFHQPVMQKEDHRWLVLDLYNDFSHLFVGDFRDLMPLDRVHRMMEVSRMSSKIVRLQFCKNSVYDGFVTPSSNRKLYFGPLKMNMNPPIIVLLQSVDSRMMTREQFQEQHQVNIDPLKRTTAFWMFQVKGDILFEYNIPMTGEEQKEVENQSKIPPLVPLKKIQSIAKKLEKHENHACDADSDDDDDCLIIDENPTLDSAAVEPSPTTTTTAENNSNSGKPIFSFAIHRDKNSSCVQIINEADGCYNLHNVSSLAQLKNMNLENVAASGESKSYLPIILPKTSTSLLSLSPNTLKQKAKEQMVDELEEEQCNMPLNPPFLIKFNADKTITAASTLSTPSNSLQTLKNTKVRNLSKFFENVYDFKGSLNKEFKTASTLNENEVEKHTHTIPTTKHNRNGVNGTKVRIEKKPKADKPTKSKIKTVKTNKVCASTCKLRTLAVKPETPITPVDDIRYIGSPSNPNINTVKQINISPQPTNTTLMTNGHTFPLMNNFTGASLNSIQFPINTTVTSVEDKTGGIPKLIPLATSPTTKEITVTNSLSINNLMLSDIKTNQYNNNRLLKHIVVNNTNVANINSNLNGENTEKKQAVNCRSDEASKSEEVDDWKSGSMCSPIVQLPKFTTDHKKDDYCVHIDKIGILRITGAHNVTRYLNQHCTETLPTELKKYLPTIWRFFLRTPVPHLPTTTTRNTTVDSSNSSEVLGKRPKYVSILPKLPHVSAQATSSAYPYYKVPASSKESKKRTVSHFKPEETIVIED